MEPEEDLQLNFDWNLCIICQETTNERLQCPASGTHRRKDIGSGYVTLAENLQAFSELGIDTPVIKWFKNLETLPACLLENQGKWKIMPLAIQLNKTSEAKKKVTWDSRRWQK